MSTKKSVSELNCLNAFEMNKLYGGIMDESLVETLSAGCTGEGSKLVATEQFLGSTYATYESWSSDVKNIYGEIIGRSDLSRSVTQWA